MSAVHYYLIAHLDEYGLMLHHVTEATGQDKRIAECQCFRVHHQAGERQYEFTVWVSNGRGRPQYPELRLLPGLGPVLLDYCKSAPALPWPPEGWPEAFIEIAIVD